MRNMRRFEYVIKYSSITLRGSKHKLNSPNLKFEVWRYKLSRQITPQAFGRGIENAYHDLSKKVAA